MSRTLFWYLFKDLLRIFFLASGVLAGIMSFGGLLRPLTKYGLDATQVGQMLACLMPAMSTYSIPIAALFATAIVYGRLSADNELTACRAAGISYLAVAMPALVLGLVVALISLVFLCFIVPASFLKAERVIWSNLAKMTAHEIQRSHELRLGSGMPTIFAQSAYVVPPPEKSNEQCVVLVGPTIISYAERGPRLEPRQFSVARQATVYIRHEEGEGVDFRAQLEGGTSFPRRLGEGVHAGVEAQVFQARLPSPIKENTKFMDIIQLRRLWADPASYGRVKAMLNEFIRGEQELTYLRELAAAMEGGKRLLLSSGGDTYTLSGGNTNPRLRERERELVLGGGEGRPAAFIQQRGGQIVRSGNANRIRLSARPDSAAGLMHLTVTLDDAVQLSGEQETYWKSRPYSFSLAMPPSIAALSVSRGVGAYLSPDAPAYADRNELARRLLNIGNRVRAEMHSRASFSVSCLILVLVGCALGMMFRSGNFLSAFAVSAIPALACITLIVAGQQTAGNLPRNVTAANFANPLRLGLTLIWGGNALVLLLAAVLLGRLQRQ